VKDKIPIRCKVCNRFCLEVSADTVGTLYVKCKRSQCARDFTVSLPVRIKVHPAESQSDRGEVSKMPT